MLIHKLSRSEKPEKKLNALRHFAIEVRNNMTPEMVVDGFLEGKGQLDDELGTRIEISAAVYGAWNRIAENNGLKPGPLYLHVYLDGRNHSGRSRSKPRQPRQFSLSMEAGAYLDWLKGQKINFSELAERLLLNHAKRNKEYQAFRDSQQSD